MRRSGGDDEPRERSVTACSQMLRGSGERIGAAYAPCFEARWRGVVSAQW